MSVLDSVPTRLFVDGAWVDAEGGATLPVEDPATGQVIARVADASPKDALRALDAAARAQREWAASSPRLRGDVLRRAYELVLERRDDLAAVMTAEMGKPLAEARGEVDYGAEFLRWFSEEAPRVAGSYKPSADGRSRLLTLKQPVGPCLMVTPWNFPLAMGTRKIAPAVAAGCTMVVKPASLTPLTMLLLTDLLREAGLPDGVLNVVTTSRSSAVTEPLLRDPRLRKLTFTGSTEVGRTLMAQSAPGLLRLSMELGGNAPFLVFEDADLDAAVEGAVVAKMRNMGEACTAANRFLVQASVADAFARRLADRLGALRVAPGAEEGAQVGPMVEKRQRDKVHALVADAVRRGARVLTGGEPLEGPGWFYPPTVLVDVTRDADIFREEVFGPVAAIFTFTDEDEALALANDTDLGLAGYAWTTDHARAVRVYEGLEVGMVGLNQGVVSNAGAPFGGIKASGFGREGGAEGIEEYLETKYVGVGL